MQRSEKSAHHHPTISPSCPLVCYPRLAAMTTARDDDVVQPELRRTDESPVSPGSQESESIYSKSGAAQHDPESKAGNGQTVVDDSASDTTLLPQGRQLGVMSATFLIVNRIVGTGVFATTSTILDQSGSVGMSLM